MADEGSTDERQTDVRGAERGSPRAYGALQDGKGFP